MSNFSHQIQYWGSTKSADRNDFTSLQEYIFMAVIAKTNDIEEDLLELDKGKKTVDAIKKRLHITLQNYTNGGLLIIEERIERGELDISIGTSLLQLILKSKKELDDSHSSIILSK